MPRTKRIEVDVFESNSERQAERFELQAAAEALARVLTEREGKLHFPGPFVPEVELIHAILSVRELYLRGQSVVEDHRPALAELWEQISLMKGRDVYKRDRQFAAIVNVTAWMLDLWGWMLEDLRD